MTDRVSPRLQRRCLSVVLCVGLLAGGCSLTPSVTDSPTTPPTTSNTAIPSGPRTVDGTGVPTAASAVKVLVDDSSLIERQRGMEAIGPQTFFVSRSTITVNDYVNNRLVEFRQGKRLRSFKSPGLDCCEDIRVEGSTYWLLAGDAVRSYTVVDSRLKRTLTRELAVNDSTQWPMGKLSREDDNLIATPAKGKPEIIVGPGPLPARPEFLLNKSSVEIHDGKFAIDLMTPGTPEDATLLARNSTNSWYWVYVDSPRNWGYVYHLDAGGTILETYTLPRPGVVVPSRPLLVSDDGKLYQMNLTNRSARVLAISSNR